MAVRDDGSAKPGVCIWSQNALLRSALTTLVRGLGYPVVEHPRQAAVTVVDLVDRAPPAAPAPTGRAIALVREADDPVELLGLGYRGYLRVRATPEQLQLALAAVHRGEAWAERWALERLALGASAPAPAPTLRERQVLRHLAEGRSNREIARLLGIAEATVKAHITSLFDKFSVNSRLELVVKQREAVASGRLRGRST